MDCTPILRLFFSFLFFLISFSFTPLPFSTSTSTFTCTLFSSSSLLCPRLRWCVWVARAIGRVHLAVTLTHSYTRARGYARCVTCETSIRSRADAHVHKRAARRTYVCVRACVCARTSVHIPCVLYATCAMCIHIYTHVYMYTHAHIYTRIMHVYTYIVDFHVHVRISCTCTCRRGHTRTCATTTTGLSVHVSTAGIFFRFSPILLCTLCRILRHRAWRS